LMSQKVGHRVTDYIPGREDIFIYGMRFVYITAAIICLVGAVLTAFRLYHRKATKPEELEEEVA
jgi:hypothetical protein